MFVTMMKSKIHRIAVTQADIAYQGSVTIDKELMKKAHILPHEKVQVTNQTTGDRVETYAICGKEGELCMNGGMALICHVGDVVNIITYGMMEQEEALSFEPVVIMGGM